MKICVVTATYTVTGVPLAQIRLAQALADRGHQVDLIVGYIDRRYTLPDVKRIRLIHMNRRRTRGMLLPLVEYLIRDNPEIVFSAEDHQNAIILLAAIISRSKAKISCSSRITPLITYSNIPFTKGWMWKCLMRVLTLRADALTCVAKDMVAQYRGFFKATRHVYAYNIIDNAQARKRMEEPVDDEWFRNKTCPIIIAAGTLAPGKAFSDVIQAVKEVVKRRRVKLVILGDGPTRPQLEALIFQNGLGDVIKLLGTVENPLKYFRKADVFVLSSLFEGLPNVLIEAMMCGCTPVSTDCPTGPREALRGGEYGYLVPMQDPLSMAAAIEVALDRPISSELLRRAVEPFTEQPVIDRHFSLLGLDSQMPILAPPGSQDLGSQSCHGASRSEL